MGSAYRSQSQLPASPHRGHKILASHEFGPQYIQADEGISQLTPLYICLEDYSLLAYLARAHKCRRAFDAVC